MFKWLTDSCQLVPCLSPQLKVGGCDHLDPWGVFHFGVECDIMNIRKFCRRLHLAQYYSEHAISSLTVYNESWNCGFYYNSSSDSIKSCVSKFRACRVIHKEIER
jgi:hypothetical protein